MHQSLVIKSWKYTFRHSSKDMGANIVNRIMQNSPVLSFLFPRPFCAVLPLGLPAD